MEKTEDIIRYKNLEKKFTLFRWILLLIVSPISFGISAYNKNMQYLIGIILFGCTYTLFATIAAYSKKNRFIFMLKATMYLDVFFISIILCLRGGIRSDVFFLYFLIISYNGAKFGYKGTISSIIQTVIYFSIAAFIFTPEDSYSFSRYIIRIVYLILTTYVIYQVNKIVNESYDREKQAKGLAMKDFLTDLPNRLSLSEYSNKNNLGYKQFGKSFCVGMFDIDDFKKINDTKGHIFGDNVLVCLANIIKSNISKDDFVCRFGGEEFVFIFANSDIKKATENAEKIRKEFEQYYSLHDKITISGGVIKYDDSYSMLENVNIADKYMYVAKNIGKNKIVNSCVNINEKTINAG